MEIRLVHSFCGGLSPPHSGIGPDRAIGFGSGLDQANASGNGRCNDVGNDGGILLTNVTHLQYLDAAYGIRIPN
jgi:hypothetical protein